MVKPPHYPSPMETHNVGRVLPIHAEFLDYAISQVLEQGSSGLSYDPDRDEVVYHYTLSPMDWELFQAFYGVEEVWVITGGTAKGVS